MASGFELVVSGGHKNQSVKTPWPGQSNASNWEQAQSCQQAWMEMAQKLATIWNSPGPFQMQWTYP